MSGPPGQPYYPRPPVVTTGNVPQGPPAGQPNYGYGYGAAAPGQQQPQQQPAGGGYPPAPTAVPNQPPIQQMQQMKLGGTTATEMPQRPMPPAGVATAGAAPLARPPAGAANGIPYNSNAMSAAPSNGYPAAPRPVAPVGSASRPMQPPSTSTVNAAAAPAVGGYQQQPPPLPRAPGVAPAVRPLPPQGSLSAPRPVYPLTVQQAPGGVGGGSGVVSQIPRPAGVAAAPPAPGAAVVSGAARPFSGAFQGPSSSNSNSYSGGIRPPMSQQQQPQMQQQMPRPSMPLGGNSRAAPSPSSMAGPPHPYPPGTVSGAAPSLGMPLQRPPPLGYGAPAAAPPLGAPPLQQQQHQQQQQHPYQQQPPTPSMSPPPPSFGGAPQQQQHPFQQPPPQGQPQQQQASGAAPSRNIDPGQMPHPQLLPPPTQVFETRRENTHNIPPPAETPIVVRDTGSAGPRYMRCSLNAVPQGADLLKQAALPFVVMINPLALPEQNDSQIDIVDSGENGPMRCGECKAYVCPYMRWGDGGRKMECCFCGATTEVPAEYFSHLGLDGARRDREERPELCRGSVEFLVRGAYQVRPPIPPTFMFLIEVTAGAVSSGATASVCASLAQLLDELPGGDRARVCIATFDSRLHFYAMRANGGTPRMLVVSDVDEPFCAVGGQSAAVALGEHRDALKSLLESIPKMFAGSQAGESAGGAALHAAIQTLKAGVGGRLMAFVSSLPHRGALALRPREAGRPPSERDALEVMVPENKGYAALAAEAAEHQVSIDIFALAQGYIDLATLTTLTSETSGSAHRYTPFNPSADGSRFHNDLRWALVRPQGYEAVARLRVSRGVAVDNYVGAFHRRNPTDLHFPALSCDHAIAARLTHEQRLPEGGEVYMQYALLYSAVDGTRRVRVHTLAIPITRSLGTVFRGADLESYLAYVARKVSGQLAGRTLAACKDVVVRSIVDTLAAYRRHCASQSSSGQLILPESLKLLPLYSLGLSKLPCFRTDARADSRAVWASRLLSLSADRIIPAAYPRLIKLDSLLTHSSSSSTTTTTTTTTLPERLWLTAEKLDSDGIFLVENGFDAFMFVGAAASPDTCTALLGVPSVDTVELTQWAGPPVLETPLSKAVANVLEEIRRQRRAFMHLRLVRRGAPHEAAFLAGLIEDRAPSTGMSYVEHLCYLHKQIQNKLNG